jgi:transcriptional regulator with XRE-family HTH domain
MKNTRSKRPEIGAALRELQKRKGLTGVQMASLLCISPNHYTNICNGKRTISFRAGRMAYMLGVSAETILGVPRD